MDISARTKAIIKNSNKRIDDCSDDEQDDFDPKISSMKVDSDDEHTSSKVEINSCKVFIGNLPFTAHKEDVEALFKPFGNIIGVNIRMDRVTNKPKGFAFVTYSDEISALDAISSMNNYTYQGRPLTVRSAALRGSKPPNEVVGVFGDTLSSVESNEWKTVPTVSIKDKKKKQSQNNGTRNVKTWDQWAGPGSK